MLGSAMEKREDRKARGVLGRRGAGQETREGWEGKQPGVGGRLGEGVSVEQAASSRPPSWVTRACVDRSGGVRGSPQGWRPLRTVTF